MDAIGELIGSVIELVGEVIVAGGCAARTVLLFIVAAVIGLGIFFYFQAKNAPPAPPVPIEKVSQ